MEIYNKKCDKNFITELNKKYIIDFYSDDNNKKYITLELNNRVIWVNYKILCSYDTKFNFLRLSTDMMIIEKSVIDTKLSKILNKKEIKNIDDLEINIMENIINTDYIGFIIKKRIQLIFIF